MDDALLTDRVSSRHPKLFESQSVGQSHWSWRDNYDMGQTFGKLDVQAQCASRAVAMGANSMATKSERS
jgi:hypothetical protein